MRYRPLEGTICLFVCQVEEGMSHFRSTIDEIEAFYLRGDMLREQFGRRHLMIRAPSVRVIALWMSM